MDRSEEYIAGWRGLMHWLILWYELDLPEDDWSDVSAIKEALQGWALSHGLDLNESRIMTDPLVE